MIASSVASTTPIPQLITFYKRKRIGTVFTFCNMSVYHDGVDLLICCEKSISTLEWIRIQDASLPKRLL